MTHSQKPVILASQSPRRKELLKKLVADFEIVPSSVEEILQPGLSPIENAIALARQKAQDVSRRHPGHYVIGADTIVVLDDEIIGKPNDPADARKILKRLSGRSHQVITGVVIINSGRAEDAAVSKIDIRLLNDEEIARYVATGEPLDKAGAYAIQGEGAALVASYSGSYSNIVGLPLDTVKALLEQSGYAFG
ncbi:MAG: Maf-like protein [Nitrospinaceae bacterium]|nr:MAG: Maf-like protein [Nitrospinaceae bacterium]